MQHTMSTTPPLPLTVEAPSQQHINTARQSLKQDQLWPVQISVAVKEVDIVSVGDAVFEKTASIHSGHSAVRS